MSTALASSSSENGTFPSLVDAASNGLETDRSEEARKACRSSTETHPEEPSARFLYGVATLQSGDSSAAVPVPERAVSMHRAHAGYRRMLGRAYRAAGRQARRIRGRPPLSAQILP